MTAVNWIHLTHESTSGVMLIINLVQGWKFLHISTEENLPVWDSVEIGLAHPKASAQTVRCKAHTKADNCPGEIRYDNVCTQVVRNSTQLLPCGHCV
jgi:hypothetical protein